MMRDALADFIGQVLIGVSQQDEGERPPYLILHFEDGGIKITMDEEEIDEFVYGEEEEPS